MDNLREIERLKAELVNAENNAKTLSNNIMQLTMNLSTSENKLNRATSQITALEGQLETSAADLSKVSGDLKTTQEQLVAAKKRVEIMEITLKVKLFNAAIDCVLWSLYSQLCLNEMVLPIVCRFVKRICRLPTRRLVPSNLRS